MKNGVVKEKPGTFLVIDDPFDPNEKPLTEDQIAKTMEWMRKTKFSFSTRITTSGPVRIPCK